MAFDGITTKAVISELQQLLIGGKINKIFNPTKNEIILNLYNQANYTLLLSANPDYCRLHLTTHTKPNPQNAPHFCMLLRKYLTGAKIIAISNYDLERTVQIKFECYNELNDLVIRKLFIQIMSRQSNIVLTNDKNIIIDSLKHFDNSLPAHPFEFAPIAKKSFLALQNKNAFLNLAKSQDLITNLTNTFIGFSKSFVCSILEDLHIDSANASIDDLTRLYDHLQSIFINLGTNHLAIKQFANDYAICLADSNTSINHTLDEFYFAKEQKSTFLTSRNNLLRIVSGYLKKVSKKLENITHKLQECEHMDTYKIYGELLTANLYQCNPHENLSEITLNNYYNNNAPLTIPLDPKINLQKNIEKYFKKYNKLKNALMIVTQQKKETEQELDYIESIVFSLENAKSTQDIVDIYAEISENITTKKELLKKQKNKPNTKKKPKENGVALQSETIEGFTVYIGKNNVQNDYLSLKFAHKNDLWFHTQKIHGSHVLLRNPDNLEVPESVLLKCATLAKENSKGKNSTHVPVDFCQAKYVKKSPVARPGLVIYTNYKTIFVK